MLMRTLRTAPHAASNNALVEIERSTPAYDDISSGAHPRVRWPRGKRGRGRVRSRKARTARKMGSVRVGRDDIADDYRRRGGDDAGAWQRPPNRGRTCGTLPGRRSFQRNFRSRAEHAAEEAKPARKAIDKPTTSTGARAPPPPPADPTAAGKRERQSGGGHRRAFRARQSAAPRARLSEAAGVPQLQRSFPVAGEELFSGRLGSLCSMAGRFEAARAPIEAPAGASQGCCARKPCTDAPLRWSPGSRYDERNSGHASMISALDLRCSGARAHRGAVSA